MSYQIPTSSTVSFRKYEPRDLEACARMAKEAWPRGRGTYSHEDELSGMRSYMEFSLGVANWAEVALASEEVIGFLFGRIDHYEGKALPRRSLLGEVPAAIRWFLNRGERTPWHVAFVWGILLTELKLTLKTPDSDASIEMFIVDSRHRGMGIGGMLLDRFLRTAKASGSSLVTVYTDDSVSNWQYYEKRGFKRIGTFYDNITSQYSGSHARGIIFSLEIGKES